jgi:hypothetical protein
MPDFRTRGLLLAGILCGVPLALASSVEEIPVEFQVRGSDMVVVATYDGESFSVIVDPTTKMPFKEQVATVSSCPKRLADPEGPEGPGMCPPTVTIRAIGGEVPAYDKDGNVILGENGEPMMLWVPDNEAMPWLRPGEHVLFLTRDGVPEGRFRLYGAAKGMRRVGEDETTRTKTVSLPIESWELLSEAGRAQESNLRIRAARDARPAASRTTGDAKTEIPRAPYYTDTIPFSQLPSLIDRCAERSRRTPAGR